MRRRYLLHFLLAALCGLLSSCIDGHEEYWLQADGSGRVEIHHAIPAAAAKLHGGESTIRAMIDDFLRGTPGIRDASQEVSTSDGRTHIRIRCAFDSALDLAKLADGPSSARMPAAARQLLGRIETSLHGRTIHFRREISPALPAALLPAAALDGHRLRYILHLPAVARDSNATRRENAGKTLVWEIPLAQAAAAPVVTRFTMDVPLPWPLLAGAALPVLAGGLWLARRKRSRRTGNSG